MIVSKSPHLPPKTTQQAHPKNRMANDRNHTTPPPPFQQLKSHQQTSHPLSA